ncbi:MAG: tripartite tricarboxylate transporter TctB family protein [Bacteroidota bacterium]
MKRTYQITSIVLLVLALVLGFQSLQMRYFTSLGPGPGFFPLWLSILMAILAVTMFIQATFGKAGPLPANFIPDREACKKMGSVVAAIIGVILLLEPLGFCFTMFGFYLFLLTTLGRQNWVTRIIIALSGSFGMYYAFVHWLACPLPIGLLGI